MVSAASQQQEILALQQKANFSDNPDSNAAIQAAISFLQKGHNETDGDAVETADPGAGIHTYYFTDGQCDYQTGANLDEGQAFYRDLKQVSAKLFLAKGQVQRQKGDQVEIEVCTGKALMDGNLLKKTYDKDQLYVINHENGTIYNDIVKFAVSDKEGALANYASYPAEDSTIIMRGSDGVLLKRKGVDSYVGQDLAYVYNDFESQGLLQRETYSQVMCHEEECL